MATSQLRSLTETLRRATLHQDGAGESDGHLLERYVRDRQEAAFTALVRRHAPMVWGVCLRVLGRSHDAEDAFQATWLLLVRKAASVLPREAVANWLYGVARQTAFYARARAARRAGREKQVLTMPEPAEKPPPLWGELWPLLDLELGRLPAKYREVLVLCDLEGRTQKEAARHARLPPGTVASRLARGRALLARRLCRHGPAVSVAALAAVLAQQASAGVPPWVVSSAIKAANLFAAGQAAATGGLSVQALALAEGVRKTMFLTRLKMIAALLLTASSLGTGAALFTRQPAGEPAAGPTLSENQGTTGPPARAKKDGDARPVERRGVVKAVDAVKNTLTVLDQDAESTFTVARDADIRIDGQRGQLAGLPTGALVTLSVLSDQKTVRGIRASGPPIYGAVVKAVDAEKGTITFDDEDPVTRKAGVAGQTYAVVPDAFILIDGTPGKLAGIPWGTNLNLGLSADQKTILRIEAHGSRIEGVVRATDSEKFTLTVTVGPEGDRTLTVAKDTTIAIDGKLKSLAELPRGAHVTLLLAVDQKARNLRAEGSQVRGVVRAVGVNPKVITVEDGEGAKTFPVASDARVEVDGQASPLAGLPRGANANLTLSVDEKTVRLVRVEGSQVLGAYVRAVDAAKKTLTLEARGLERLADVDGKTFTVARDARVEIDGKPGQLAEVPVGALVDVSVSADRATARGIRARGSSVGGFGAAVLKAVDAGKNTVTVEINQEGEKTFVVAQDTAIEIDGKPGKLTELPRGAAISLSLRADQKTTSRIEAKRP